jgi:four helix bundle protein
MAEFAFVRMDVYRRARVVAGVADELAGGLPSFRWPAGNQLVKAALSVMLNIAEGAGEYMPAEKARFYRMARRSAFEAAAVFHYMGDIGAIAEDAMKSVICELERIAAALTSMIHAINRRSAPKPVSP